jgi:hypothetical protein
MITQIVGVIWIGLGSEINKNAHRGLKWEGVKKKQRESWVGSG